MNSKFMKKENRRNIVGSVSQTSERGDMGKYLNNSESCDIGKKNWIPSEQACWRRYDVAYVLLMAFM